MLRTSVRDLITRAPITIDAGRERSPGRAHDEGARRLLAARHGRWALAGIVTDRDLRNRVLAVGVSRQPTGARGR